MAERITAGIGDGRNAGAVEADRACRETGREVKVEGGGTAAAEWLEQGGGRKGAGDRETAAAEELEQGRSWHGARERETAAAVQAQVRGRQGAGERETAVAVRAEAAIRQDGLPEEAGLSGGCGRERHSRQIRFAPIGDDGQAKLAAASVFVAGAGALGASLAQHMVRAGVGRVRIADRDYVEFSNLQRQVLFDEEDARRMLPKAVAAATRLRRIDGSVVIDAHLAEIGPGNVDALLDGADLILDGLDNVRTRLLLEAAARRRGIPYIYGGVSGSGGMTAVLGAASGVCLGCLIGTDGDAGDGATCDSAGIIAPAAEMIAALQAAEALKWLTDNREALRRGWLSVDLWPFRVRESALPPGDPDCPACLAGLIWQTERPAGDEAPGGGESWPAVSLCGRETVQVTTGRPIDLDEAVRGFCAVGLQVSRNPYLVRAELPDSRRLVLFADGRALLQGTEDTAEAERLCRLYLARIFRDEGVEADGAAV